MHDCPRGDIRDLLPDLLHDRLAADARRDVERHVATCPECAEELELLRTMYRVLSASDRMDVNRVVAAVRAGEARRPAAHSHARRVNWRVAAAAAVLLTGGLTVAVLRRAPVPTDGGASDPAHVATLGSSANTSGLMFGGGVADLPDGDIERLLQDVDSLSALPDIEPAPVLRGVGVEGL